MSGGNLAKFHFGALERVRERSLSFFFFFFWMRDTACKPVGGARSKYGCSTVVFICFTCPAMPVGTVFLRALERVRGRALGWLGPGSLKSQPHQALRGVAKPTTGLGLNQREMVGGPVTHDLLDSRRP